MLRLTAMAFFAAAALAAPVASAQTQTGSCADEVKKMQASTVMQVQGGGNKQETGRLSATTYLQQAAQAAAQNDEKTCRDYLNRAKLALTD